MGIYGPHTWVKCLLKAKFWSTYKKNILIYSQMIFHLDERHCLKATVLEGGKKSINWVSVGNFKTSSRPNR